MTLKQQANYLRQKAYEFECEAARYDGLSDQAVMLSEIGQHSPQVTEEQS